MKFIENKGNTVDRDVTTTFLTGKTSCTLIISKEIAKKYGIDEPSHVVIEGTDQGILVRKLELDSILKESAGRVANRRPAADMDVSESRGELYHGKKQQSKI